MAAAAGGSLMLWLDEAEWAERRRIAAGPLEPLARSLAADLDRLLPDENVYIPHQKAKLTRQGGRCARDGRYLEFDPRSPRVHRCPHCGTAYDGEDHFLWWVMGYQLWLAERAVHGAVLWRCTGNARHRDLALAILAGLAERYPDYPNRDNVLGPTRVFFSTYLESIWLLQVCSAVAALEDGAGPGADRVRERIIEPSSALIEGFNEGDSNRQVWNSAALAAAGRLLHSTELVDRALHGRGGLVEQLRTGLFDDGSWYEGENYHLFAHRGLLYLMTIAERAGASVPPELAARFDRGFATPLLTALPDLTFPARRDSQYGISLRQWRFAESLELGVARHVDDERLAGGLRQLYGSGESGDAGRWRSTAEAERNLRGVRLTRADLGWKSLLFAKAALPAAEAVAPASVILGGQGVAVIRRDEGRTWVGLDYGHAGGSHGHPDRLALWLVRDGRPILEDVGTGSYVDPSLHWYRSTLAHNAPLVDGRSQVPVTGTLRAWDVRGGAAWVSAEAEVAPDVVVMRTIVVAPGHLVDVVDWRSTRPVVLDLPMHLDGEVPGASWTAATLPGGNGLEDGFSFLSATESAPATDLQVVSTDSVEVFSRSTGDATWWRAVAPGPPGSAPRRFLIRRMTTPDAVGRAVCVWCWDRPANVSIADDAVVVQTPSEFTRHTPGTATWRVDHGGHVTDLAGAVASPPSGPMRPAARDSQPVLTVPLIRHVPDLGTLARHGARTVRLGAEHYRRTEESWVEAGKPTADVALAVHGSDLMVEVTASTKPDFAPRVDENPLDNEHPDTNSNGVQLHLAFLDDQAREVSWLMVPETDGNVRVHAPAAGDAPSLDASWRPNGSGWQLRAVVHAVVGRRPSAPMALDVIVNEKPRDRQRRRGQLVLSGAGSGWAYLRGDRQDRAVLVPVAVRDA